MEIVRLCEWGKTRLSESDWPRARRAALEEAAQQWRETHRLNALPLEWSGSDGCTLTARQWVGVVEIEGAHLEIYPKTDANLLARDEIASEAEAQSTLRVLLRMLEASHFPNALDAGEASLHHAELTFVDVWARLFAVHLRDELRRGLVRDYLTREDDLFAVRGRIQWARQITHYGERLDRIACRWDEYSPDISLLRLLKCAARLLHRKAGGVETIGLLSDCLLMLDEVADVSPAEALAQNERPLWSRSSERFRRHFELARWILRELGPQTGAGESSSWSFFVDMNQVFESFVGAALSDRLGVDVQEQHTLGHLIHSPRKRHAQIADFVWRDAGGVYIGDAKWKLIQDAAAENTIGDEENVEMMGGKVRVNPADIRQLTTYAELYFLKHKMPVRDVMLLFPAVGLGERVSWRAWNGANFHLVPVALHGWQRAGDALQNLPNGILNTRFSEVSAATWRR